jgi:D-beta-D-heptose 7-phosphate kinase/D-beta-D-heptose 1-phosphate adenosyltransferase
MINTDKLKKKLVKLKDKQIVVIGDLMIDHYFWGNVDRISPEAPIPVVDVNKVEHRLGGAANVVNNIYTMGAKPLIIGLIGDDIYGEVLTQMLKKQKISTNYLIVDKSRPTTVKARIFAGNQQLSRYDIECRKDISEDLEAVFIKKINSALRYADAVIIEDYNKGLLTPKLINHIITKANEKKIPITVDPKFKNFQEYKNVTVFKPNLNELQKFMNVEVTDSKSMENLSFKLFKLINPKYLVITLGNKGLKIFNKKQEVFELPAYTKEVFDVSGAGDTVISILTLCLTLGFDIIFSSAVANHAAAVVCGKKGISPATIDEIILSINYYNLLINKRL